VRVKDFLKNKNVPFEDIDVSNDSAKAQEMFKTSGQYGVPVITVDDKIIIGFDPAKLNELLK
jgi:alkyl hydroperoxide reductase subunit F